MLFKKVLGGFFFFVHLRQLVEPPEELVEGGDELGGRQLLRQRGEVHDVRVQDAAGMKFSTFLVQI